MKSLNDSLREEFKQILKEPEINEIIINKNLEDDIIYSAFEKLLSNKSGPDENSLVERGRAEFETYIINTLKTKAH